MKKLQDKVAIVTASITGIGFACLKKLAENGATTYLAAHLKDESMKVMEPLIKEGLNVKYVYFNALDSTTHAKMIEEVINAEGKLDILVNNFGATDVTKDKDLVNGDTETFFKTIRTNLESVYLTSKAAVPHMIKQGNGSIINISSIGSITPDLSRMGYAVSKSAINSLTQNIALQYARFGVRCNAILPGATATPALMNNMSEEFIQSFLAHVPLNRMGQPEDIANAVLYFASDDSSYATGIIHNMAGGYGLGTPQYSDFIRANAAKNKNE